MLRVVSAMGILLLATASASAGKVPVYQLDIGVPPQVWGAFDKALDITYPVTHPVLCLIGEYVGVGPCGGGI